MLLNTAIPGEGSLSTCTLPPPGGCSSGMSAAVTAPPAGSLLRCLLTVTIELAMFYCQFSLLRGCCFLHWMSLQQLVVFSARHLLAAFISCPDDKSRSSQPQLRRFFRRWHRERRNRKVNQVNGLPRRNHVLYYGSKQLRNKFDSIKTVMLEKPLAYTSGGLYKCFQCSCVVDSTIMKKLLVIP